MSVTYTATLPVAEETVRFVSGLLGAQRRRRGTRGRRRALGCCRQAVGVLRWFVDGSSPRPPSGCAARCWPPGRPAIRM